MGNTLRMCDENLFHFLRNKFGPAESYVAGLHWIPA